MEIRRCGGTWACCDGDCSNCYEKEAEYTNNTRTDMEEV